MSYNGLINLCREINIKYEINGKTAPLTSIKVGIEAKLIVFPSSVDDLCIILTYLYTNNIKYFVLGNGTNVYFCDYYDGVVVVTKCINSLHVDQNMLICECGVDILKCARMSLYHSLSGLEFAYGIPGSIGGAIYMNASAFGYSFSDIVHESTVYDIKKREVIKLNKEEHCFSTKSSIFSKNKELILLQTTLKLKENNYEKIHDLMLLNMKKRADSQPLNLPNAGSAFKRNDDVIPSKLIDEIGLKGYRIGDAMVSKKHAGFIVNLGSARAQNIIDLINHIKSTIYNEFNVKLEEEIIYIE